MNLMFVDGLVQAPRYALDDVREGEEASIQAGLRAYFGSSPQIVGGLQAPTGQSTHGMLLDKPNRVRIDGFDVSPIEQTFEIVQPQAESRPGFEQNPLLLIPQVHVVLEFPCKQPPRSVEIVWGTFPLDFLAVERDTPPPVEIEAILIAEGESRPIVLTRTEPSFTWHGVGTTAADRMSRVPEVIRVPERVVPIVSVFLVIGWIGLGGVWTRVRGGRGLLLSLAALPLVGVVAWACRGTALVSTASIFPPAHVPRPPDDEAISIFKALQANVYRAFDYTDESEVYDALAQSVAGPLLDSMYNQVFRSLVMYDEGGAVSRVNTVQPISVTMLNTLRRTGGPANGGQYSVDARWRVEGIVYHWGHSHTRWNEYVATYELAPTPAGWRIVGYQTREQFRVDPGSAAPQELNHGATQPPPVEMPAWHPIR